MPEKQFDANVLTEDDAARLEMKNNQAWLTSNLYTTTRQTINPSLIYANPRDYQTADLALRCQTN